MTESDYLALCGWKDEPKKRAKEVAAHGIKSMPRLMQAEAPVDVLFWEIEEKIFGSVLQTQLLNTAQAIGDCVSWGESQSNHDAMLANLLAINGTAADWPGEVATEPTYGGSRCEIGGWWGDTSDGSIGLYGARWTKEYGILLRKNYGTIDLTTYSGSRAKSYGSKGCPDELEPLAKEHPITAYALVTSYEQVKEALCALKPVANASNAGFEMKRGSQGICRRTGTWMHEMCYRGHCVIKGNKPMVVQKNSWGDYLGDTNNRVVLESGREITLPKGHFLVHPEDVTYQAKQGDTTAKAGVKGWEPQTFSWDV